MTLNSALNATRGAFKKFVDWHS